MSTKNRKRASNVLLLVALVAAAVLWAYGARMAQDAREQEHRNRAWRDIINHSSSAVIVSDDAGRIVQWSDGAVAMLGWGRHEVEGADLQLIMPPDSQKRHTEGFCEEGNRQHLFNGGVLQIHGYVLTAHGQVLPVDIRVTAVRNGVTYYVAHITLSKEALDVEVAAPPPSRMQYSPPDIQEFRS